MFEGEEQVFTFVNLHNLAWSATFRKFRSEYKRSTIELHVRKFSANFVGNELNHKAQRELLPAGASYLGLDHSVDKRRLKVNNRNRPQETYEQNCFFQPAAKKLPCLWTKREKS